MGFFKSFGLDFGNAPGAAAGSSTYLPITILRTQSISDEANKEYDIEQNVIEMKSYDLAKILSQKEDGDLVDTLSFSIREIVRNVVEHSKSKQVSYCAQYWPTKNKVEIAILDSGTGLKESIEQNPYISVDSDSEAIQKVLMPSVSSKHYKGVRVDKTDPWRNSGFGLYMTSRLCRHGGEFFICSGDHGLQLNEHGKTHMDLGFDYKGTIVRMILDTSKMSNLKIRLDEFRTDADEIIKDLKNTGDIEASSASQMLSRDFAKIE